MTYLFASLPTVLLMRHIARNSKEEGENVLRVAYATIDAFLKGEKLHAVKAA
jgi:phosphoglycerate dehydrogenase-like enzyme